MQKQPPVESPPVSSIDVIRNAALSAFNELGYHGTSTREISKRAGIGVATLYHHFSSKQVILVDLVTTFFSGLLEGVDAAVEAAPDDPRAQLEACVREHIRFSIAHQSDGFVAVRDFRSLNDATMKKVLEQRVSEQRLFEQIIRRGVRSGVFDVDRPTDAARAIIQMCTAVMSWYQPDGNRTAEELAEIYVELSCRLVRAT